MIIQDQVTIAAGATVQNIFDGSQWEFLPWPAGLEIALIGDANGADLRLDLFVAGELVVENAIASNANRSPVYPDDFNITHTAYAGGRLKGRVRNSGAAAVVLKHTTRITRLG